MHMCQPMHAEILPMTGQFPALILSDTVVAVSSSTQTLVKQAGAQTFVEPPIGSCQHWLAVSAELVASLVNQQQYLASHVHMRRSSACCA